MSNIVFNLPYKVINKNKNKNKNNNMPKFSIIILSNNDDEKIKNLLNIFNEFKELGGEIHILNPNTSDGFLKSTDNILLKSINYKFNKDEKNIIDIGDVYYDYTKDINNIIDSISSNDMIFIIDSTYNLINFNLSEIEKYITTEYDVIEFKKEHKLKTQKIKSYEPICEFYNKNCYKWENKKLIYGKIKKCIAIQEEFLSVNILEDVYHNKILKNLSVDCFLNFNDKEISNLFGLELFKNELFESAYYEFNRYLEMENDSIRKSETLTYIGDYYNQKNKEVEMIDSYTKAYIECSKIRLPLYKLGYYFFIKKDWEKCIFYIEGCLNISKIDNIIDNEEIDFMYKDGPYSMLYVAYWWFGDMEKSKEYLDKALEISPYNHFYLSESNYHYEYGGNNINGNLSFKEIQYLYDESKKAKSILEIYPENGRSTHALIKGCNGLVTVITKNQNPNFIEEIGNPGNLRILNMSTGDAIKILESENKKFDMIFINRNYNEIINDYNPYWSLFIWEKFATKLICGYNYNEYKEIIDKNFEISGIKDTIWYKNISSFEKTTIYKKKI